MSASSTPDTIDHEFKPNPGAQEEFIKSTERQLLYSGSFGAGKSRAGCEKGYFLNMKYPGNRGLVVRKSLVDVKASTVRQSLLEDVIPESHIIDHNKGDNVITHHTGATDPTGEEVYSEIHYYGVNSGQDTSSDDLPRKIGSTEFGWIFVDEGTELSQGEWNQLLGRLRHSQYQQNGYVYNIPIQQIFTATNPDSPNHWMHDYFGIGGSAPPGRKYWTANLWDNQANLPDEYIKDLESSLAGMYYERYVEGRWVGAEGMVYDEYDPSIHLLHPEDLNDQFGLSEGLSESERWSLHGREEYENDEVSYFANPPEHWRVYRAIDFGYRNPFVCQFWARSQDDELVLFREIYQTETTTEELAPRLNALLPDANPLAMTVADHDAENHKTLQNQGIGTVNADKAVEPGIQSVKERFKLDDRGRPGIYFMQGARAHEAPTRLVLDDKPLKTVEEIYDYEWDEDDEEPLKENDHGMDAMRYLVHTIDAGANMSIEDFKQWEAAFN